ncbi:MAG TPA: hypothetical protein VD998_01155 [Verrucomicrobiae bacterium]|nr:hypothetical protein [Verrucomicrobiae bacterium]
MVISNISNLLIAVLLLTTVSVFGQKSEQSNYYAEVLARVLSDPEFTARFHLKNEKKDTLLVVIDQAYNQIQSKIADFVIRPVLNENEACARMKNGELRTVIFLSPIQVIDSLQKFYISVTCFILVRDKNTCHKKSFSGGFFSTSINSNYIFRFDHTAHRWRLE